MNPFDEFLNAVNVIDTESTGLDTETAELVEISSVTMKDNNWYARGQLFNTIEPIPFEATAVHNITRKMVAEELTIADNYQTVVNLIGDPEYLVAYNVQYDHGLIFNNFKRIGQLDALGKFQNHRNWICAFRVAKHFLKSESYKLTYLKYSLDLDLSDIMQAHRAEADAIACARLLERLIEIGLETGKLDLDSPLGDQLLKYSWDEPIIYETWPMHGKHLGHRLVDIPNDYYNWCFDKMDCFQEGNPKYDHDLVQSVARVIENRN